VKLVDVAPKHFEAIIDFLYTDAFDWSNACSCFNVDDISAGLRDMHDSMKFTPSTWCGLKLGRIILSISSLLSTPGTCCTRLVSASESPESDIVAEQSAPAMIASWTAAITRYVFCINERSIILGAHAVPGVLFLAPS
jgi:hypothetical protein